MKTILTDVTYIGLEDLNLVIQTRLKSGQMKFGDIEYYHISDQSPFTKKFYCKLSVIILSIGGKYKVLKSRY